MILRVMITQTFNCMQEKFPVEERASGFETSVADLRDPATGRRGYRYGEDIAFFNIRMYQLH
jgi:hypothetical protein